MKIALENGTLQPEGGGERFTLWRYTNFKTNALKRQVPYKRFPQLTLKGYTNL